MQQFLRGVKPNEREAALVSSTLDADCLILMEELKAAGLVEIHHDTVRFATTPGEFPALALELWGQSLQEGLNPQREQRLWQA